MQWKISISLKCSLAVAETNEPCLDELLSSPQPCFYAVLFGECLFFYGCVMQLSVNALWFCYSSASSLHVDAVCFYIHS